MRSLFTQAAAIARKDPGAGRIHGDSAPDESDDLNRHDALIVLTLCAFKILCALIILSRGYRILIQDEVYRWSMATDWMANPTFAPPDHVWLGGFFYLVGGAMKLFGTSFTFGKLFPLALSLGSIPAFHAIGLMIYRNRLIASLTTFLYVVGTINTWISISLMPEMPTIFFAVIGMWLLLKHLDKPGLGWVALGSICVGISTSFRYEAWFYAFGCSLAWVWMAFRKQISIPQMLIAGAGFSFYVFAWMWSGYLQKGDPLLFFHQSQELTMRFENPIRHLAAQLSLDDPFAFGLGAIGAFAMFLAGNSKQRVYGFAACVLGAMFIYAQTVGTASTTWRVAQFLRSMIVITIPFPLVWLVRKYGAATWRRALVPLLLAGALVYGADQRSKLCEFKHEEFDNDTWAVAEWLRNERLNPHFFREIKEKKPRIVVLPTEGRDNFGEWATMAYVSSYGYRRFTYEYVPNLEADLILIREENPLVIEDFKHIRSIGKWKILVRTKRRPAKI